MVSCRPICLTYFLGKTELTQTQSVHQQLLGQRLFRENSGCAWGSLVSLWRIEQEELLDLSEFFEQLLHQKAGPGGVRLPVDVFQQRYTEHAVEGVNADLAVGPVVHGPPAQPVTVLQATEDLFDLLLT